MKDLLKRALFALLYYSGLERLLVRFLPADAAVILMYHGVSDQHEMPPEVDFHVSRDAFERQIRMLKRRYEIVGMSDLLGRLARRERLHKEVVLTFDDGYRNNLEAAAILGRFQAPFSVYLATGAIGSGRFLPLNELYALYARGKATPREVKTLRARIRALPMAETATLAGELTARNAAADRAALRESFAMLGWDEVRELSNHPGVEIGAHSHSHCNLAAEPPEVCRRELETCRQTIARELGSPPRLFTYPFGGSGFTSGATRQSVIESGFECAITTHRGVVKPECDPFSLPRLGNFGGNPYMLAGELLYLFARELARGRAERVCQ